MQTSRLKNIIILILALVNLFLLGTLISRQSQEYTAHRQTAQELVALFASAGVQLDESIVRFDPPPPALSLTRSIAAEQALAAWLLGDGLTVSDEGGGIYTYASATGRAVFRASGGFEITGELGDDPAAICLEFCEKYGCQPPEDWLSDQGSGDITAVQYYNGYLVDACGVTFLAQDGQLRSVIGTFLPTIATEQPEAAALSAASALTSFLDARRISGAVASTVTDIFPCYTFQSTAAAPMILTPTWCVVTDGGSYYVNPSSNRASGR